MKQFELVGEGIKLILKENVMAVLSDNPLNTVSSAFYNGGGLKKTKAILNVEVIKSCSDQYLHDNPEAYIIDSSKKFGLRENFIGMVTAAAVENFSLVSKRDGELAVSVIATAADNEGNTCNYAESAGETIEIQTSEGTINIIVVIDGNPTESCLAGTLITVTEAKMAALRELDVRSRSSGDEATGTVTDAIVVAETNRGAPIVYGGPASKLGQLVGYCTRKAVKEAITKANEFMPYRSIKERLRERHMSIEKIASELSKVNDLKVDTQMLAKILGTEPLFASLILAAVKMDDDIKKGLVPSEFGNIDAVSERFGSLLSETSNGAKIPTGPKVKNNYDSVDLPPFTKHALINIVRSALSKEKTENLK
jgi:iron complex transport system ATP-binding protein